MTVMTVAAVQGATAVLHLVARALDGDGGALVVRGGTRTARTALLAGAPDSGLHRLATSGVPAESSLRGAGLHRLLRPLAPQVAALPRPQAAELARVLGHRAGRVDRLVAGGATNREIAARLQLSPRTVEHHLRQIFARLEVRSRVELTRELLSWPGTASPS